MNQNHVEGNLGAGRPWDPAGECGCGLTPPIPRFLEGTIPPPCWPPGAGAVPRGALPTGEKEWMQGAQAPAPRTRSDVWGATWAPWP